MTDVISEFWWPDYSWETARVAVMFGIRGPGERLMIAYGPDPGRVFHQAELTVEYSLAKIRGALCAMLDELTDKRIANDDFWIDVLANNWWSEAFMADADEMGVTLKQASPDGYPYTVGVAEAREGKELQHSPPPEWPRLPCGMSRVPGRCASKGFHSEVTIQARTIPYTTTSLP